MSDENRARLNPFKSNRAPAPAQHPIPIEGVPSLPGDFPEDDTTGLFQRLVLEGDQQVAAALTNTATACLQYIDRWYRATHDTDPDQLTLSFHGPRGRHGLHRLWAIADEQPNDLTLHDDHPVAHAHTALGVSLSKAFASDMSGPLVASCSTQALATIVWDHQMNTACVADGVRLLGPPNTTSRISVFDVDGWDWLHTAQAASPQAFQFDRSQFQTPT